MDNKHLITVGNIKAFVLKVKDWIQNYFPIEYNKEDGYLIIKDRKNGISSMTLKSDSNKIFAKKVKMMQDEDSYIELNPTDATIKHGDNYIKGYKNDKLVEVKASNASIIEIRAKSQRITVNESRGVAIQADKLTITDDDGADTFEQFNADGNPVSEYMNGNKNHGRLLVGVQQEGVEAGGYVYCGSKYYNGYRWDKSGKFNVVTDSGAFYGNASHYIEIKDNGVYMAFLTVTTNNTTTGQITDSSYLGCQIRINDENVNPHSTNTIRVAGKGNNTVGTSAVFTASNGDKINPYLMQSTGATRDLAYSLAVVKIA